MEARDTVDREGALDWHCSLLWVMKAGRELNCFLHFPHRKTSSSSVGGEEGQHTFNKGLDDDGKYFRVLRHQVAPHIKLPSQMRTANGQREYEKTEVCLHNELLSHIDLLYTPMGWMVDAPETFWLFGSGTPPCPSSRDWTASTVWLSMPEEEEESGGASRSSRQCDVNAKCDNEAECWYSTTGLHLRKK